MINVTIWNEFRHEKSDKDAASMYPEGIHAQIGSFLKSDDVNITYATLDMPEHGLTDKVLNNTDVLMWWGHMAHGEVSDDIVKKVYDRVLAGMGLVVLHSGHHSKIFRKLIGTSGNLSWHDHAKERVWCVNPAHPIAAGIDSSFVLEKEEVYSEPFDIPQPDDLIFAGWYSSGEVFRCGFTYSRGYGKIFYFQPGHETYASFHDKNVQKIIENGVNWVKPTREITSAIECPMSQPFETGDGIL